MDTNQTHKSYSNFKIVISLFLVLMVTLTPTDGKVFGNYLDKVVHFLIFFLLSISICNKYQGRFKPLMIGLFLAVLLGVLTELLQQYISGRNREFFDGVADTLGVGVGYMFFLIYNKKISHSQSDIINKHFEMTIP